MNATGIALLRSAPSGRWSLAAFVFAVTAVAGSAAIIFGSQDDPWGVRWWLVAAPIAITAFPLVVPKDAARFLAALTQTAWCVVAAASIGMFFLPALVALWGAWIRERA